MKNFRAALICSVALVAVPAHAGDEVLYADVPAWVSEADMGDVVSEDAPAELLRDWQYRIEDGVVHSYTDRAVRIENPQALMNEGTLNLTWLPDKGDLTVHHLEIRRGDEVIDLVEAGASFDVLRREQGLEQRLLDGVLTATMAVPGLREGDVLRVAFTRSVDDQALGDEVQVTQFLPSEPWQVGTGRTILSWPSDEEIFWDVEEHVELGEPEMRGEYHFLEVELPLGEAPPMPGDAPSRYQRPTILRAGSFEDWTELSRVMTPHFENAAQLGVGSDVAAQAAAIMARTDDPMERMAQAVQLVQDEVSYLLNGLDGGNYLPQSAEDTWDKRYGDCKAKSVLLLSLLREMGIESEVVLVTTRGGDAVPELLPLPAAFNHMIVHAVLDGTDYWLDGTTTATRLSNIADVPPFFFALPLRDGGTDLVKMEQRDLAAPQMAVEMRIDHSAGLDLPALFDLEMQMFGPNGAPMRAMVDADNPDMLRQMARTFASGGLEGAQVADITIDYDEEAAVASLHIKGVATSAFEWRDGRIRLKDGGGGGGGGVGFNPNRARPSWRDIPVATPGPGRQASASRIILPDNGEGFRLDGEAEFAGGFANTRITRTARIEDGVLVTQSETFSLLGEISPEELPEAKRAARRLENSNVELIAPEDVIWRWELDAEERAARAEPILAAYAQAIEFADEDDYGPLQARAIFLLSIYDFERALEDFDILVEESPSAWAFHQRASIYEALDRREEAIADLQAAYDLNPANNTAFVLARQLAYGGQTQAAQDLLESLPVGDDDSISYADTWATVTGLGGDVESGLSLIADEVANSPQNASLLNSDCWYRGLFDVALDDAVSKCTRAVERASNAAPALDSRALVRYRLGMLDEAISDLNSALEVAPGLAPSLYLRGVVRLEAGDGNGREDIATALRMEPNLADFYSRHGVVPPS